MGTISRKFLNWFVIQGEVSKAYAHKAHMLLIYAHRKLDCTTTLSSTLGS